MSELPFCLCGCARRVKKGVIQRKNGRKVKVRFYDRDCYTRSGARAEMTRINTAKVVHKKRRARFQRYLDRLGTKFTQQDLLAVMAELASYYYSLGQQWDRANRRVVTPREAA